MSFFKAIRNGLIDLGLLPADADLPDRSLSREQRTEIIATLEQSPKGPVVLETAQTDSEAVQFEGQISEALAESGFEVKIANALETHRVGQPSGVILTIANDTLRPRHAGRILRAFRRAGLAIATRINPRRRKKDALYITVGPKENQLRPVPPRLPRDPLTSP